MHTFNSLLNTTAFSLLVQTKHLLIKNSNGVHVF